MELLIYLAKVSCLLTLFWVIYKVFLEAETYHRIKRIYLHSGYALSLILPLFTYTKIEEIYAQESASLPFVFESISAQEITKTPTEVVWTYITEHSIIELTYLTVSLAFLIHFLIKLIKLTLFLKHSKAIKVEGIYYIERSISEGAFSFLNYIVYDPRLYSEDELKIILEHEQAHITGKHSLDILFAHVYNAFFWFNPFAWLYQKALVLNLEYEADAKVVANTAKRDYQMTLYKVSQQQYRSQLQHSFHQSPIKKRITMLNQNKKQSFWKLFIVSPLLVAFFLLFQVETKAQVIEAEIKTESSVSKVEMTFDETTTKEDLESAKEFLKEDFDINMIYSDLEFKSNGDLKSLTIEVSSGALFKGSASSSDVSKNPIYFFRDFSEDTDTPFGVGAKPKKEQIPAPDFEAMKDVEVIIINENKIVRKDLLNKYIPVKSFTHIKSSRTLYITTRPEFSELYYSRMFEAKEELKSVFEEENFEEVVFFNVREDDISPLTINNFKLTETSTDSKSENKSTSTSSSTKKSSKGEASDRIKDAENFIINGKKIDKEELANTYIPFENYSYDENSKTLTITTRSEFSETYYSSVSRAATDLVEKFGDHITEKISFFNVKSNYEVVTIILTDFKISTNSTAYTKPENLSLSYTSSKADRKFLESKSTFQNQDMVFIIDGVKSKQGEPLNLNPDQIESVEVVKSPEELKAEGYNSNFVKGITKITTKKGNTSNTTKNESSKEVNKLALKNSENAIYLVDGKEVDTDELNQIKPEQIKSIDVVKSAKEIKSAGYSPKEVESLIKITTKTESDINAFQGKKQTKNVSFNNNQNVIFLVDGKELKQKEFNGLDPNQIQSVEVIKSPYDLKEAGYDPKKVDGVVKVTTKTQDDLNAEKLYEKQKSDMDIDGTVIYLVDGKEVSQKKFNAIKPEHIESLDVLKNASGIKDFGYDPNKIDGLMNLKTKNKGSKTEGKIKIK